MNNRNGKYIKSFDALRVIALLGVFLYHLMPNFVPSGYLGVVIFFVLAGFLTMKQIIDRDEPLKITNGIFKIGDKIFKLYPALLFTILLVTGFMLYYFKDFLIQYPVDAISSIFSVNNYAQILRNESYFEAMNSIKPLTHIWALSLEFQFYIAFFLFVYPFYTTKNKNKFFKVFLILAAMSIALAILLVQKGVNLTRIYYSFDSRLATFLIGVIAAIKADDIYSYLKKVPGFVRLLEIILLLMLLYAIIVNFSTDTEVVGIIITYSILSSFLLLLFYSDEKLKLEQSEKENNDKINIIDIVITEIVKRSYIIYLVHYPIIIFSNRFLAHANVDIKLFFACIILITIVVFEIVYRLVQIVFFKHNNKKLSLVLILSMAAIFFVSCIIIKYHLPNINKSDNPNDTTWLTETSESEHINNSNDGIDDENYLDEPLNDLKVSNATTSDISNGTEKVEGIYDNNGNLLVSKEELNTYQIQTVFNRINKVNAFVGGDATLTREEFLEYRDMKISFIGDSVTQGSRGSLSVYFPNAVINAEGNRQLKKALPIFYEMKEKGELGDVVVVALGTNSDKDIRVDVLEEIYENLDDRMMIILTVAIPYVVEEERRNSAIRKFADMHDNCYLADWYNTMKTHSEYFVGDGTHPQGLGTDVYAQLIFKTAINSLTWRKKGNEWQYYESDGKLQFAVEIEKNIGDVVSFGSYYINSSDKKEPIEWIVVDKNDEIKTELLITKYAIDRKKYNDVYANTTWQKSEIRKWLNDNFYREAFENVGAKFVLTSAIDNHKNPEFRTSEANVTYDRVFLPSYDELKKYVKEEYLKCEGTEYFKSIGGYVNDKGFVDWWTRTAGDADNHVMNVSADGEIVMKGDYITTDDFGIRPMIKITYK